MITIKGPKEEVDKFINGISLVDKFINGISLKEFTSLPLQNGLIASYKGIDIEAEYTMDKLNHTVNLPANVINFINGE